MEVRHDVRGGARGRYWRAQWIGAPLTRPIVETDPAVAAELALERDHVGARAPLAVIDDDGGRARALTGEEQRAAANVDSAREIALSAGRRG
jgi:hypothetical protein